MAVGSAWVVGSGCWAVLLVGAVACAGRQDRVIGQGSDPDPAEEAPEPSPGPAFVYLDDEESQSPVDRDPRALIEFRASLAGYGAWVDDPRYGTIWVPDGPAGFAPYRTDGHWELDPDGNWAWASDYPWGEVTFHYGRWSWAEGVGWFWVPGYEYAPAWVIWESSGEYVGWAPAPPRFFWRHRVATAAPRPTRLPFCFAPTRAILSRDVARHLVRNPVHLRRVAARSHVVAHPVPVPTSGRGTATRAPVHVPARAVPVPTDGVTRRPVASAPANQVAPAVPRPLPPAAPAHRAAPMRVWRIPLSSLPSRGVEPAAREARTASRAAVRSPSPASPSPPPPGAPDPRSPEFRHVPIPPAGTWPAATRGSSPAPPVVAAPPPSPASPPPPAAAPARPPMAPPHLAPRPAERPGGHDDRPHHRR